MACCLTALRHHLIQHWCIFDWNVENTFDEISIKIKKFSFKKMHMKILSAKRWPLYPGLNVLQCHLENSGHFVQSSMCFQKCGACLNIKMSSNQYRDSHYKDKMVITPCYLYIGSSHTLKDCLDNETGPWPWRSHSPNSAGHDLTSLNPSAGTCTYNLG